MLRSGALKSLQPAWRSPLISLRHQSTVAAAAVEVEQPAQQQQQQQQQRREPLSARLGGSGRGKSLEAADPFAAFLNNAQQKNRRMPQRGNRKDAATAPGQFDDAQEKTPQQQRPKKNNNRPQRQKSANGQPQQKAAKDKQQPQRQQRQNTAPRKAVESRRVTTFIDKDIDWTAISGFDDQETEVAAAMVAGSTEQQTPESRERMLAEMQTGDYDRYLQVANGLKFAPTVSVDTLNSLMGANASYGFDQKTAFLNAVSKATAGAAAASK